MAISTIGTNGLDQTSNIGIGTTSADSKLELSATSLNWVTYSVSGTNKAYVGVDNGTPELVVGASAGDLVIRSNQKTWFGITGGGVAGMIDSSGNWGIGTSSPNTLGSLRALTIASSSDTAIEMLTGSSLTGALYSNSNGLAVEGFGVMGIRLFTASSLAGSAEAMRIDTSGNVGIGTSSPAVRLHVTKSGADGELRVSSAGTYSSIMQMLPRDRKSTRLNSSHT